MSVFRIDDVSVNTDIAKLEKQRRVIREHAPNAILIYAISPIVFSQQALGSRNAERVHPPRLTAQSSLHPYYRGTRGGLPYIPDDVTPAGHGLMHVDHRLLSFDAQEMSIVGSCSLAFHARIFVPPYNKWNETTEKVCDKHGITLVKFEDGWEHVLHNPYDDRIVGFYFHSFDLTAEQLDAWFRGERD